MLSNTPSMHVLCLAGTRPRKRIVKSHDAVNEYWQCTSTQRTSLENKHNCCALAVYSFCEKVKHTADARRQLFVISGTLLEGEIKVFVCSADKQSVYRSAI